MKYPVFRQRLYSLSVNDIAHESSDMGCEVLKLEEKDFQNSNLSEPILQRKMYRYELKILEDEKHDKNFVVDKWEGSKPSKRPKVCPISGKPARYIHPRTGIPYHDLESYKIIEKMVANQYSFDPDNLTWISNCNNKKLF
ncbi:hypothetical protein AYI68_g4015 [Smittium mucronatum]|uniref:Vps72/YL1 C-terminal domain-containing protein n=1 Tax=Smittium mucronatum TaxID=133383 RepID=A0A1R0GY83_9FUNG|nr:hypothetical protein AYI68_g4640 [Smittium mucronatum]OLY81874.1 hypothetical protein AYI68_g4015 [Smittium mucronatum]